MFTKGMVEQGVSHNTIRIFLLKDFLFAHQSLTFATTLWLCVCWEGLCGCVCAGRDSVVVRVLGGHPSQKRTPCQIVKPNPLV